MLGVVAVTAVGSRSPEASRSRRAFYALFTGLLAVLELILSSVRLHSARCDRGTSEPPLPRRPKRKRGATTPTAWRSPRRFAVLLLAALVAALAAATVARAEIIVARDAQGRAITFDVRATAVDVEWYAAILRAAAHGNEISTVTIRILPEDGVEAQCEGDAVACYGTRRGVRTIVVPAGRNDFVAHALLHEYGHHLDSAWPVVSTRELDGTPVWWSLRGMATLLDSGSVAFDYSLGWSRSIAEIFAEDYAYIHLPIRYSIRWLSPPDDALRNALLAELGGTSTPAPAPPAAAPQPVVVNRSGTLAARGVRTLPFELSGPGRRVTYTVTLAGANRARVRARAEIVCDGARVASRNFGNGVRTRTLDVPNLGPAECEARLVSTSRFAHRYTLSLRLAVEG